MIQVLVFLYSVQSSFYSPTFSIRKLSQSAYVPIPDNFILEKVTVVSRHGDRSQIDRKDYGVKDWDDNSRQEFWKTKMPTSAQLKMLASAAVIPAHAEAPDDIYHGRDKKKYPYGMLTEEGVNQLSDIGKVL